jgi:hypothetical protein
MPEEEEMVSSLTENLENWPEVLGLEEAQNEISLRLKMLMPLARVITNNQAENGEQAISADLPESRNQAKPSQDRLPDTRLPWTPESLTSRELPGSFPGSFPSYSSSPANPAAASRTISTVSPTLCPEPTNIQPVLSSSPDPISVIEPSVIPSIEAEGGEERADSTADSAADSASESEIQLQRELASPEERLDRHISADVDKENIISGKRARKPRVDPDFQSYLTIQDQEEDPPELLHAFIVSMHNQASHTKKRCRDQLPTEPRNWAEMKKYAFAKEFT